jgi:hypothetical protein
MNMLTRLFDNFVGNQYENVFERVLYLAIQIVATGCIVYAFLVPLPSPLGVAAAGSAASAALGMALRQDSKRGRLVQVLAALVALTTSSMLLLEGHARREQVAEPPQTQSRATSSVSRSGTLPTSLPDVEPSAPATPPSLPAAAHEEAVAPISEGREGEHDLAAGDVDGMKLPDLGEGNPFTNVAMTKKEVDAFIALYLRFVDVMKELQGKYARGEMAFDEFSSEMTRRSDQLTAELETLMGEERVAILIDELSRYYSQFALNLDKIEIDMESWKQSAAYQATESLSALAP